MNKKGFTLIEIMVIVAIIGLLATIAIPNFLQAMRNAKKSTCIQNLKQIQNACQLWAIVTGAGPNDIPFFSTTNKLVPDYMKKWPTCDNVPYAVPVVKDTPVCPNAKTKYPDHVLNPE